MAKKEKEGQAQPRSIWRYLFYSLAGASALVFGIFVFQRVEHYLINSPKFAMAAPADYGEDSPSLHVNGVQYASRAQIMQIFTDDFGRSLYLFPMAKRRNSLLGVQWVKDASIMRIWPNQAAVHITERRPAAFIPLKLDDAEGALRTLLIDEEGVILEPRGPTGFKLPVLMGINPEESRDVRQAKVRRMQRVIQEAGALSERISDFDIASLENVKVTMPVENRALVLFLGSQHYAAKLQNFLRHYAEVRRRLPNAVVFDLRIEDRITAVEGGESE